MFSGVYFNHPLCPSILMSIRVSICVQNTSFCKSAGRGIKSHLVTALVHFCTKCSNYEDACSLHHHVSPDA